MRLISDAGIPVLADKTLYAAVLRMLDGTRPEGRVLDVPAGYGAFAAELLRRGWSDIHCLDLIAPEKFLCKEASYRAHDLTDPLPFPDGHFDYVFGVEGIEHLQDPWLYVKELCRVLKPGGRLFITTPNTFSVDARLKYLVAGYYPRFRSLMLDPEWLMNHPVDDAHIAPIYFWQLNYFLLLGQVKIQRISTNALVRSRRWATRLVERLVARIIRTSTRRRGFPDPGITSDEVLFGDCIIVEGRKKGPDGAGDGARP